MRLIPQPHRLARALASIGVSCRRTIARLIRTWRRPLLIAALAALISLADGSSAHAAGHDVLAIVGSVNAILTNVRNWIMGILAGLATVFLTIGGVRYVMANGDPGEVDKAKTAFRSAGYGYVLAALAPLVVQILKGIVGS
jgi:Type IV secretion system pilin